LRASAYASQLQCRMLYVSLDEVSRQTARHNGTSWHLDGAACPSFVSDVRECHPLLRPPFDYRGKGQRMASNGPFDWTTTSRPLPTRRPTLECENLFQTFRGVVAERFLFSESTAPPPLTIEIFPFFCSSTYAILPLNFSSLGIKITFAS